MCALTEGSRFKGKTVAAAFDILPSQVSRIRSGYRERSAKGLVHQMGRPPLLSPAQLRQARAMLNRCHCPAAHSQPQSHQKPQNAAPSQSRVSARQGSPLMTIGVAAGEALDDGEAECRTVTLDPPQPREFVGQVLGPRAPHDDRIRPHPRAGEPLS